jgi:ATP-dependent Lon protease
MPSRIPLFPLKIVLFPGALLPLHIFEPRYRELLADVTLGDHRFGLLPPGERGGLPARGTVGCVALVRAVQPLGDGRSNIVVSGERRFALLEPAPAGSAYAQGLVEWVEDTADVQVPTAEEISRLRALAERYAHALQALNDQPLTLELAAGYPELSFEAAALLEWEFEARQRFLEIRSATERVARLLHALPGLVESAERRAARRARARHNGHGSAA